MAKRERLRSRGSIDKPDPPVETAGCWLVDVLSLGNDIDIPKDFVG